MFEKNKFDFIYDNSFKDLVKERLIDYSSERFFIAGRDYLWWDAEYSFPLHINFQSIIRKNIKAFISRSKQMYKKSKVCFSVKTYPNIKVLQTIASEGAGADVVSDNELRASIDAGILKKDIFLNGNCKSDDLISRAIKEDIVIVADNVDEFKIISSIAESIGVKAKLLLRLSGFGVKKATEEAVLTSGEWTKFGENINNVSAFIRTLKEYPFVNFLGFHTHIGTQITDISVYASVMQKMIEISLELLQQFNIKISILNIGGGFPVQYLNLDQWTYMKSRVAQGEAFAWANLKNSDQNFYTEYPKSETLEQILKSEIIIGGTSLTVKDALFLIGEPELVVEPGRSVVCDSGITLANVSYTRQITGGHNLVNLEFGGSNMAECLLYPNMKKWIIVNKHLQCDLDPFEAFIAGNLCFTGDMLAKYKVLLQRKPARGDTLLIFDTGGTGQHFFAATPNSFPRPPRILVTDENDVVALKLRDRYEDIIV